MLKFSYTGNHKDDEAYMQQMCAEGWAAVKSVEGFWIFQKCDPEQYTYRIAYLRGKSPEEFSLFKKECSEKGIEFVSKYSFWAIFRSEHPFEFYTGNDETDICKKIYRPMPVGAAVSSIALIILLCLTIYVSKWFIFADVPVLIYCSVCLRCSISYHTLIRKLEKK